MLSLARPDATKNKAVAARSATSESIELLDVSKMYGTVIAVRDLTLQIEAGEFISLLGPSGCGKTTTLRMIAGLETVSSGTLRINGLDVTAIPAYRRQIGMVFQSYALFPHRTVGENVAFGLRMRGISKNELANRVGAALELVELSAFRDRRPAQLSGGQQQRVALARAIVIEPKVLLCDEPLGALDKRLRTTMQSEMKMLQRKLGITLVYVTHDQEEAFSMSDRIAVMSNGRIEQLGTPPDIYNRPATRFVAEFIGVYNVFNDAHVAGVTSAGNLSLVVAGASIQAQASQSVSQGQRVSVAVRQDRLRLAEPAEGSANQIEAIVEDTSFLGSSTLVFATIAMLGDKSAPVRVSLDETTARSLRPGARVKLWWDPTDTIVLQS